jgi:hypothetical protein
VAFILFTNYMITDPGTTPTSTRNQIAFGVATAAAYAGFMLAHISYGIFFGLTLVCALRGGWLWLDAKVLRRSGAVPPERPGPSVPDAPDAADEPAATGAAPERKAVAV